MHTSRTLRQLAVLVAAACALTIGATGPAVADPSTEPSSGPSNPPTGILAGTFTTAAGAAVPDVEVAALRADNGGFVAQTRTSPDGSYTLTVPTDTYVLSFTSADYAQYAPQKTSPFDAQRFPVRAGSTTTVHEKAVPSGRLSGRLTDAAGTPVANSDVLAFDGDSTRVIGTTREDGTYQSRPLRAGTYRIGFSLPGNVSAIQYVPGTTDRDRARAIEVPDGQTVRLDEQFLPTGTLVGRVSTADGQPLAGAHVTVFTDSASSTGFATSGADGSFRVVLFAGRYRLHFGTADWNRNQYFTGVTTFESATVFTVEGGRDTMVSDRLLPTGALRVTATDARTGARLTRFCAGAASQNECSDGTGEVLLTGIPATPTEVHVYTEDGRYHRWTRVEEVRAEATTDVAAALQPGGAITTVIRDAATGQPVEGACAQPVLVPNNKLSPDGWAQCSGPDGRVTIGPLDDGRYRLFVRPPTGSGLGMQWVGNTGGTGDDLAATILTTRAGQLTEVPEVRLDRAGKITGRVTSAAGGQPVTSGVVSINSFHPGAGVAVGGEIGPDGRYTIDGLGPYSWPVLFAANGKPWQWHGGSGVRAFARLIPVRGGEATTLDAALLDGATVTGRTSSETGGWMFAINSRTGEIVGATAASGGRYSMPVLGPQVVRIQDGSGAGGSRPVFIPRRGTVTVDLP